MSSHPIFFFWYQTDTCKMYYKLSYMFKIVSKQEFLKERSTFKENKSGGDKSSNIINARNKRKCLVSRPH